MVSVPEGTSAMFQGIKCRTIAGFSIQTEYSETKLNIERSRWHWQKVPDKCVSAEVHTMPGYVGGSDKPIMSVRDCVYHMVSGVLLWVYPIETKKSIQRGESLWQKQK